MKPKRISIRGMEQVTLESFELSPADSENGAMILETKCSLISPGTEAFSAANSTVSKPHYPGYTSSGVIVKAQGKNEKWIGKNVFVFPCRKNAHSGHASYKSISNECLLYELPSDLSFEQALFARMVNIALTPFLHSRHHSGVAVVHGLGLVGNMIVQVGRLLGFTMIGADLVEERRNKASSCGCHIVCSPSDVSTVVKRTNENGASLVIDTVVVADTCRMSLEFLGMGGDYSPVGIVKRDLGGFQDALKMIWQKNIQINSGWEMSIPFRSSDPCGISIERNLHKAFSWLRSGLIQTNPLITDRIKPEDYSHYFGEIQKNPANHMGIVLDWTK
jgi:threonine dehydrogenase-like Zn-dependent dehydrogenase